MICPVDHSELTIADRAGIEIDWCPTCRGVWLDRGELDKIVERSAGQDGRRSGRRSVDDRQLGDRRLEDDRFDDDIDDDRRPRGRRRREGFLGDLFDF